METNTNGTFFQEGDQVRIKRTGEKGRINATDGGVVYVLMDKTNEAKIFSVSIDEDAYIELFLPEANVQDSGVSVEKSPAPAKSDEKKSA